MAYLMLFAVFLGLVLYAVIDYKITAKRDRRIYKDYLTNKKLLERQLRQKRSETNFNLE